MSDVNKTKRTSIKGLLTRFTNYFNGIKNNEIIDFTDLRTRLANAEEFLEKFNEAQLLIEIADPECDQNYDAIHAPERQKFEDDYYSIIATVKQFIEAHTVYETDVDNRSRSASIRSFEAAEITNIQLPQLNLPSFDGSFDQWLFFRDSFNSIIHENTKLSNVQKFHYLRLSLRGTAADTIKSLQICDDSYNIAWKLLTERFENKPLLVNNHIKALFALPTLTKETPEGLRNILDGTQKHLRSLSVLGCPTEHWSDLVVYLTSTKFDNTTRRAWESRSNSGELPTLDDLLHFLKERCRILESMASNVTSNVSSEHKGFNKTHKSKSFLTVDENKCILCGKEQHKIYSCPDFVKLTPFNRLSTAKRLRLCINCLGNNHSTKDCKSPGCRKCTKIHHTLLHFGGNSDNSANSQNAPGNASKGPPTSSGQHVSQENSNLSAYHVKYPNICSNKPHVLLSTALVRVFDKFGKMHDCRILLDNGSESNFISERLCNLLRLPKQNIDLTLSGINNTNQNVHSVVNVRFKSAINNFERQISCLVLPHITGNLPHIQLDSSSLNIPQKITLADPYFGKPAPVDLLIGADTFWDLLSIGQIKLGINLPTLHKTKLGWIISGPIYHNPQSRSLQHCFFSSNHSLENQLTKFWELEECPKTTFFSEEEIYCENHFKHNVSQNDDGHFIVALPLKTSPTVLGDSKITAINRFHTLERKLEKNLELKSQYHDFMREYIHLGHMSISDNKNESGFFLPHHCVLKQSSTTRLRVVFDGSVKSSSNYSLNDIMMVGPTIQDNLFSILLRFRKHSFVLSADVAKMYRQVFIREDQRYLQKIVWRFSANDEISVYTLNTVTYGTASASFLAIRALHEVAHRHINELPEIASVILRDFYVDDLLTGCDTLSELNEIKSGISDLLLKYGFALRKWRSNAKLTRESDHGMLQIGHYEQNKTLGLLWNSSTDCLQYFISIPDKDCKITKRHILSCAAQIFDPLGILAPIIITAKIILQELWKLKLSWDESIPADLHTLWSNYRSELVKINDFRIPRHIYCLNPVSVQLHAFCDASKSAYGACIYVRCTDSFGNYTSNLCCAKTRVAPLKVISIPRLELCGALLLAELVDKVISSFTTSFESVTYWCDSTVVISWIHTSPHLLKTFVANRIAQIHTLSNRDSWKYVSTLDNPADLLSRGLNPSALLNSDLWFHGPNWLSHHMDEWPSYTTETKPLRFADLPETCSKTFVSYSSTISSNDILNYSSLTKLKRVFAYVLRFINNSSKSKDEHLRQTGPLTVQELEKSLEFLIRIVQQQSFPEDYLTLLNSKELDKKSKLLSLNPFMDKHKLLRVGGRLSNSKFDFSKRHPIILPSKHHLTTLIIRYEHLRLLHAGPQALLASLRERFWPLSGRNAAKKVTHDCVRCFRFNYKPEKYLMGNLPSTRVTQVRPFSVTGVDYAGPFLLRDRKGRNFKTTKAYVSLFICFVSKAVHLEVVSDLTTDCFLAALRRFMARRGKCSQIVSDNGTTFVGANNELRKFFDNNNNAIAEDLSNEGVQWKFIPPRAPHFGGIWESGVKSVKYHLRRVMGDAALTFEEFCTVLCQIEACLNSRPLYPLSHDPNDLNSITPAHLLIGERLTSIPDHNFIGTKETYLSRFQRMQQILQHFWSRWTKEYVSHLQQRIKWKENVQQLLAPGILVLIKDDGLPPLKWQLGRIVKTHAGNDGIIRTVTIKTSTGEIKRPVVKVCKLPHQSDEVDSSKTVCT